MQVGGENYLIPIEARLNQEQDVKFEGVPAGRVLSGMEDAGNRVNIIILDACRDNPFARSFRSSQQGRAVVQAARGVLIAYATAPGSVAADGSDRNGVYTQHLLRHMATAGLSIERMFRQVRTGVVEVTGSRQTPWESSSLTGEDFYFVLPETTSPPARKETLPLPVPAPVPQVSSGPDPEAEMWALVKESVHVEDIQAFLRRFPQSRLVPHAQLRLEQLQRRQVAALTPRTPPEPPSQLPVRQPRIMVIIPEALDGRRFSEAAGETENHLSGG